MNLNGTWKLYYAPQGSVAINNVRSLKDSPIPWVDATVPGNVELDLSAAGVLPADLFHGMNILEAEPYELYEWWYETAFTPVAPDQDHKVILHFGAVDCFADYYLNGELIGSSDNMFIAQDFDVTELLLYGQENSLHVHISSATIKGAAYDIEPGQAALAFHPATIHLNVRKAPHSYGWDIMPRAVSAGIWRDVELRYEKKYDFRYLYFILHRMEGNDGVCRLIYDTDIQPAYVFRNMTMRVSGACGDSSFFCEATRLTGAGIQEFTIPNIRLWWPKHYGDANLYDITVQLLGQEGELLMERTVRRGFRSLVLKRSDTVTPDGCFEFIVNGQRVMLTGSNWVPMDAYHSRDKDRYQRALEMADDLGCNILRCWGGNVYEEHAFFDFCDEHGILIWQDFAMACHYYPQTHDFMEQIEKEAQWVVKELRDHPSLAIWSGDNEIDQTLAMVGNMDPSINRLTREVLPRVIERLDPYRPYLPSSPYISSKVFAMGDNSQGSAFYPEAHLWGPRDYFKSSFYKGSNAYFVSEAGYHGCPSRKSLEKFLTPDALWPYTDNQQWNLHSTDQRDSDYRVMLMHRQVQQLFGEVPKNMDDYTLASQISQAEAKKFFIEHMRAQMKRNGGIIWWNLIDGWPQMSDAIVDYYYEKKLAYDFIKRSQRNFIIMMDEMTAWGQPVLCANSTLHEVSGTVKISDMDSGQVVLEQTFTAAPNANTSLGKLPLMYSDQGMFLIEWQLKNGEKHFNTYLYGTPKYDFQRYKEWLKKLETLNKMD